MTSALKHSLSHRISGRRRPRGGLRLPPGFRSIRILPIAVSGSQGPAAGLAALRPAPRPAGRARRNFNPPSPSRQEVFSFVEKIPFARSLGRAQPYGCAPPSIRRCYPLLKDSLSIIQTDSAVCKNYFPAFRFSISSTQARWVKRRRKQNREDRGVPRGLRGLRDVRARLPFLRRTQGSFW